MLGLYSTSRFSAWYSFYLQIILPHFAGTERGTELHEDLLAKVVTGIFNVRKCVDGGGGWSGCRCLMGAEEDTWKGGTRHKNGVF
jgi:hypothetical protein